VLDKSSEDYRKRRERNDVAVKEVKGEGSSAYFADRE
jgi:hypothetical protein